MGFDLPAAGQQFGVVGIEPGWEGWQGSVEQRGMNPTFQWDEPPWALHTLAVLG